MKHKTICLTQANDEGFDSQALNFDIKNMSNVKVYQVVKVVELIKEGHLHYVKLEFIDGEIADPDADPMIVGTITKKIESTDPGIAISQTNRQRRVLWDNKLWHPLDEGKELLEAFMGIKATDVAKLAEKLAGTATRTALFEGLMQDHMQNNPNSDWTVQ